MSVETFPLPSFKDAATHLRRPFTPQAVKFKVQATWPKENPTGGMIVGYIDARLVIERLNLVVPHLWTDFYEQRGQDLACTLVVDGLSRSDVGEGTGKAQYSDALKRAAVKFGVGVSLYAIPRLTLKAGQGLRAQGDKLLLTPEGEQEARTRYARWLDAHGKTSFGEPLDHGDLDGAQGDTETDEPPTPAAAPSPASLSPEKVDQVIAAYKQTKMPPEWLRLRLVDVGAPNVPDGPIVRSTIHALTFQQATRLIAICGQAAEDREKATA